MTSENVLVVIDTHNINSQIKKKFGLDAKLDYLKYLQASLKDGIQYRAIAYGAQAGNEATKFISFLKKSGFEIKFKQLVRKQDSDKFFYVDHTCDITVDVLRVLWADKVDRIVLGSSDPQYVRLAEEVKNQGCKFTVIGCKVPKPLRDAAMEVIDITEDMLVVPQANLTEF